MVFKFKAEGSQDMMRWEAEKRWQKSMNLYPHEIKLFIPRVGDTRKN